MGTPNLLNAIYYVLTTANLPLALFCFVMAGFQLRAEGGINFDANGSFFRWIMWGAIMATVPEVFSWLGAEGVIPATNMGGLTGASAGYTQVLSRAISDFVNTVILDRLVPIMAGALVIKALLDAAEGHSPLPSIFAAIFLLGVNGIWATAETNWLKTDQYATTEFLEGMLNWAMVSVCPVLGVMCLYTAILQYVKRSEWVTLALVGVAFLGIGGIWSLIQGWVGVTVQ